MRRLQIGVMGSAADLRYGTKAEETARELGKLIAKSGNIVVYGAEKDYDSLSTIASRAAKKAGGTTIGITYGKGKQVYDNQYADIIIPTGIERGGGREFVLVNSCDVLIAISGGSGTLTEIAIAYQANIPVIVLTGSGGWSDKLADQYLDDRKRIKAISAKNAKEAFELAISLSKNLKGNKPPRNMKLYDVTTVKGFQDYLPPESLKRAKLKEIAKQVFEKYGFQPIETPTIEYDELMKGDEIDEEKQDEAISDRFRLRDKGGRNLGLRYEFTFQLSRILKENPTIKMPFRRYQIGPVFRDEPIRVGRTREFTQCDIDVLGDDSIEAEVECLAAFNEIFKEIGLKDVEVTINNRKLLNAIIESVEIKDAKQVMRELDKIDKIGEDQVKVNLKQYTSVNQVITLFKLMEKDLKFFKDNAFDGAEEVEKLLGLCKSYGIETRFAPNMIRGFSYYTGNIFEIETKNAGAIAGGGRYDKSVGEYLNREIPAVGVSFSLESILGKCKEELEDLEVNKTPKALIVSINQEKATISLTKKLRKKDIPVMPFFGKPGKALEYANSQEIEFAVMIGEREVEDKKYTLKEMSSGEEQTLTEKQLIKRLSR